MVSEIRLPGIRVILVNLKGFKISKVGGLAETFSLALGLFFNVFHQKYVLRNDSIRALSNRFVFQIMEVRNSLLFIRFACPLLVFMMNRLLVFCFCTLTFITCMLTCMHHPSVLSDRLADAPCRRGFFFFVQVERLFVYVCFCLFVFPSCLSCCLCLWLSVCGRCEA